MIAAKSKNRTIWTKLVIFLLVFILIFHISVAAVLFIYPLQLTTSENTGTNTGFSYLYHVGFDVNDFYEAYQIETVEIHSSFDGHVIPADYITQNGERNAPTVIMVHGSGGNRMTVYPMAKLFLDWGYNVIAYDQRSSGDNTARYTTFGYWECYDTQDYVEYARQYVGSEQLLGLWGTSFGAATVGLALAIPQVESQVDFVVLDCPLGNMKEIIKIKMDAFGLRPVSNYMLPVGSFLTKLKMGFSYEDVDVYAAVSKTDIPILVYNTKSDQVTPWYMGQKIYDVSPSSIKYIYTAQDSYHVNVFYDHYEDYKAYLIRFLDEVETLKWANT